jgi:heat shock protein HtpX
MDLSASPTVALACWLYVAAGGAVWLVIAYLFHDRMIHRATGAEPVARTDQPRFYSLVENLCISRGLAVPKLFVIETDAMNAYASGIDQRTYSITATRGLINRLTDAELEAVLAHELTHIIDRDARLLIVSIVFVGMISFVAQMFYRTLRHMRGGGVFGIIVLVGAVGAGIGYLLALILRLAISREREYLADAGSVELTKRPEALISALRKISEHCEVPHVPTEVRQMFIVNPPRVFAVVDIFGTHPPLIRRIQRLCELGGLPPEMALAQPGTLSPEAKARVAELEQLRQTLEGLRAGQSPGAVPAAALTPIVGQLAQALEGTQSQRRGALLARLSPGAEPAEAPAPNLAQLTQALGAMQSQLRGAPHAGQSPRAVPTPAAAASTAPGDGTRKRGLGFDDFLLIAIGLAIGAIIAIAAFP